MRMKAAPAQCYRNLRVGLTGRSVVLECKRRLDKIDEPCAAGAPPPLSFGAQGRRFVQERLLRPPRALPRPWDQGPRA